MEILKREFDKEKTQKSYSNVAWFYNFWGWLTETKAANTVIKLADIRDHQKILEVACGTGAVFQQIVKHNPNGENLGVDLSPDMLKKARQRMAKLNIKAFNLQEGNAMNLEMAENYYDIIINNFMIDLMPEESFDTILSGFYRVLKPGGIVVISIFSPGWKGVHRFWRWIAKAVPGLLTGCRPVAITENLLKVGFTIEDEMDISQNTFPSKVIKARKPG